MTSLLVVVPKKKEASFIESYYKFLIEFNEGDYENWKKRTFADLEAHNKNIENIEESQAKTEREMAELDQKHRKNL